MRDQITKTFTGVGCVAELRNVVRSFEHLGFDVVDVKISGEWSCRGSIVDLRMTSVSVPQKKFAIASDVWVDPTENSFVSVTGERDVEHRPERDLYTDNEPDREGLGSMFVGVTGERDVEHHREGLGAGHRIDEDDDDAPPEMSLELAENAVESIGGGA